MILPLFQTSPSFEARSFGVLAARIWKAVWRCPRSAASSVQLKRGCGVSMARGLEMYSVLRFVAWSGWAAEAELLARRRHCRAINKRSKREVGTRLQNVLSRRKWKLKISGDISPRSKTLTVFARWRNEGDGNSVGESCGSPSFVKNTTQGRQEPRPGSRTAVGVATASATGRRGRSFSGRPVYRYASRKCWLPV